MNYSFIHAAMMEQAKIRKTDACRTTSEFKAQFGQGLEKGESVSAVIWQSLAHGGPYLSHFLKADSRFTSPPPPTEEDYQNQPESERLDKEIEAQKAIVNDDSSSFEAHEAATDALRDARKAKNLLRSRQSELFNNAKEEWDTAAKKKSQELMFLCLALRRLGQIEALLFQKVRRLCKICDVPIHEQFFVNRRRPGHSRRPRNSRRPRHSRRPMHSRRPRHSSLRPT